MMRERRHHQQRRSVSPHRHQRQASDFALNGENGHHTEPVCCIGCHGCGGGSGSDRKKSPLRRAANVFRLRLRQVASAGRRQGAVGLATYLIVCVLLVWLGLNIPALLKRNAGDVAETVVRTEVRAKGEGAGSRVLAATTASSVVDATGAVGSGPDTSGDGIGPTLAYGIMVYQRKGYTPEMTLHQFTRMFEALYDPENTYVVHVDIKSDQELLDAISGFVKKRDNTHEVPSVSVSWGGVTVVERTLALMQKATEVDSSWRFFVNLGHEDYPSASQHTVRTWLKDQPDGTNFIKCWPIEGHNFFGQFERHESRVKDVHVDDFMGTVKEYRTPTGKPGSQERVKSDYRFFKSLQQTMLSRPLTEYAVTSSAARRLLLYMATSKAPDELYFPTLTQLDERFSSMATCNDTRHFSYWVRPGGSWHPEYLTLDHLPLILGATEFYVRKVEEGQGSGPLLDALDLLREGHSAEDTLPILKAWLNKSGPDGRPLASEGGPINMFNGTVEEAHDELFRRQSEEAEARRARFLMHIHTRNRKRMEVSKETVKTAAGSKEGDAAAERPGARTPSRKSGSKPFGKREAMLAGPEAATTTATGGGGDDAAGADDADRPTWQQYQEQQLEEVQKQQEQQEQWQREQREGKQKKLEAENKGRPSVVAG